MEKEICAICESRDTAPYFGSDDRIYRCLQCDTVALAHRLHINDLDDYYGSNQVYSHNVESEEKIQSMIDVANEYLDILLCHVDPVKKRFLDIGANYGALVREAGKHGFIASGLEKNTYFVEEGKKRGLDLSDEDITSYLRREKLDVIAMMHVLEHLPDPKRVIKDVHDALTPGGSFLVEVPNIESYLAKRHGLSWKYIAREHLFYFSPKTLTALLQDEGFEILAIETRNHFIKDLGFQQLMYYISGTRIERDRFLMKQPAPAVSAATPMRRGPFFRLFKKMLVGIVHLLRRQDFILVLARKRSSLHVES